MIVETVQVQSEALQENIKNSLLQVRPAELPLTFRATPECPGKSVGMQQVDNDVETDEELAESERRRC